MKTYGVIEVPDLRKDFSQSQVNLCSMRTVLERTVWRNGIYLWLAHVWGICLP